MSKEQRSRATFPVHSALTRSARVRRSFLSLARTHGAVRGSRGRSAQAIVRLGYDRVKREPRCEMPRNSYIQRIALARMSAVAAASAALPPLALPPLSAASVLLLATAAAGWH